MLYNDATHGLQIITDKNITQKVDGEDTVIKVTLGGSDWTKGKTSYNSAIETLNNEAEKYLNTAYAYDARCVGSLSTIGENGAFDKKDIGTTTTITLPSNYTRPSGWTSDDTGCYDSDTNYTDDETAMKGTINLWGTGQTYWLASRLADSDRTYCDFHIRQVYSEGNLSDFMVCRVYYGNYTYGYSYAFGLRPCFSLKSELKVTGEDGKTVETAYEIE